MNKSHSWRDFAFSGTGILILLALFKIILHALTNGQYGFHRDELAMLDDARHLDWGFVAYPPVTAFITRIAFELFGPSLVGLRFFSAVAQAVAMLLTGWMVSNLGGKRLAQIVAGVAVGFSPVSLMVGTLFQYTSFDYLWWILIASLVIQLLKTENPRWWLAIGIAIGIGVMTKYLILLYILALVTGVVFTPARRYLSSSWLWAGAAISLLIFLPNLVWQMRHDFISVEFMGSIHARDIEIGRTDTFLIAQLLIANPVALPLWVAGLYFYFFTSPGKRFRPVGWMYAVTFVLLIVSKGRDYYLAPAYPMLIAAGAVVGEQWLATLPARQAGVIKGITWGLLSVSGVAFILLTLPIAPVKSPLWNISNQLYQLPQEEIGWPELVKTVADIYASLPADEKPVSGILAGNYGEAGAVNLFGPAYGLPEAISGVDSFWLYGYGDPPPQTLIVLGFTYQNALSVFQTCELAGHITNSYDVENEETTWHPDIYICRGQRKPWPELWPDFRWYGLPVKTRTACA